MAPADPPASGPRPEKSPDALRTIGEVADALGIRQHVLRYWEEQFPMLRPLKRSGGRRYYRPEDVALVQRINQLVHGDGYTLKGARSLLAAQRGKGRAAPPAVAAPAAEVPASGGAIAVVAPLTSNPVLVHRLRAIRGRLAAALAG